MKVLGRLTLALALVAPLPGEAGVSSQPGMEATLTLVGRAQGAACAESCRRDYSSCIMRTKGSPTCSVRLQQCLQMCLARRRR